MSTRPSRIHKKANQWCIRNRLVQDLKLFRDQRFGQKVHPGDIAAAASVAGLLITTEAMVAELPKKESAGPAMPGGGVGGMDY